MTRIFSIQVDQSQLLQLTPSRVIWLWLERDPECCQTDGKTVLSIHSSSSELRLARPDLAYVGHLGAGVAIFMEDCGETVLLGSSRVEAKLL